MREQLLYFDDEQIQKPRKRRQPHQKPRNSIAKQYNHGDVTTKTVLEIL